MTPDEAGAIRGFAAWWRNHLLKNVYPERVFGKPKPISALTSEERRDRTAASTSMGRHLAEVLVREAESYIAEREE